MLCLVPHLRGTKAPLRFGMYESKEGNRNGFLGRPIYVRWCMYVLNLTFGAPRHPSSLVYYYMNTASGRRKKQIIWCCCCCCAVAVLLLLVILFTCQPAWPLPCGLSLQPAALRQQQQPSRGHVCAHLPKWPQTTSANHCLWHRFQNRSGGGYNI